MELADAAAADRARLDAQLAAAEDAASGQGLEAFFRNGDSALDPGQFLEALTVWTVNALDVLTPEARLMAQFVACLEDGDRNADVVGATWGNLWQRLDRPGRSGPTGSGSASCSPRSSDPQGVEQALAEILGASADPPAE
jgi:hypothetical protein